MTNDKPLRAAIVGTKIGCLAHVRAMRGAGFDVAMLVGRDAERTEALARHFGIPRFGTSYDEVVTSDVDAIVLATPPDTHHPFTMRAIAANKHVLLEKPIANDIGEAVEMGDAAHEAGLAHLLVHGLRWAPPHAMLRDLVGSGALGSLVHATFMMDHSLTAASVDTLPEWWLDNATGGGWLRNYNSHGIDLVRYMLGEFAAVAGTVHSDASRGMRADDGYSFAFRLADGAEGVMAGTSRAWDFYAESRVSGTQATARLGLEGIVVSDAFGTRELSLSAELRDLLEVGEGDPGAPRDALPDVQGHYDEVHRRSAGFQYPMAVGLARAFRNRILDPSFVHAAMATFDDGIAHLRVIDAVEESSRSGRWIELDPAEARTRTA